MTTTGKVVMIGLLVAITFFLAWNLQFISFDFEFEKFFPKHHPESALYKEHVKQFGYDNDYLLIILENKDGVFRSNFLQQAEKFEKSLLRIDDVIQTYSPLSLQHAVKSPTGLVIFPLLHVDDEKKLKRDSIRIFENEFYRSAFSEDARALSIYLNHEHFDDPERSEKLIDEVRISAEAFEIEHIRLVGKLSASQVFIQYIQDDFGRFLIGSLIVSFLLLALILRNANLALFPFLISILSLVWLFGTMGLLGVKVNLLSSLLPPMIFFVSMSDAIHLINALKKSAAKNKHTKLLEALKIVWTPTLLTSITTAIGFLSLVWISTEPVQLLGLFAALGIVFAFLITFTLGLLLATAVPTGNKQIGLSIPSWFLDLLLRKQWIFIILVGISVGILIPGLSYLKINSFLLDDLPPYSEVRKDFEYADNFLGGSKPYEIRVEVVDTTNKIWDKPVMDELHKIEEYLCSQYPVAKLQSPVGIVKYLTMVNNGGLNKFYSYPENESIYNQTMRLRKRIDPKRMDKIVVENGRVARLIGFFPELGSYETNKRNEKMLRYFNEHIDQSILNYRITGTTYLIDKSHELLSRNLLSGLLTAIGVIGIILGLYFKSWKLLIISLLPNLIPLIIIGGILGWMGISLKMTTSIIFAIAFGIAVDDTIHMMSYYLHDKQGTPKQRLERTFKHAGSAMLITSLIMCAGFSLFLFSNFGATFYLGLFISLSLTIALIIDLTVLPLLLMNYAKNRRSNP